MDNMPPMLAVYDDRVLPPPLLEPRPLSRGASSSADVDVDGELPAVSLRSSSPPSPGFRSRSSSPTPGVATRSESSRIPTAAVS